VSLDANPPVTLIPGLLEKITHGAYSIESASDADPEYALVHDRYDSACWLWSFEDALRFIEAYEPTFKQGDEEKIAPERN